MIEMNGNVFDTFYKYPDPNYVTNNINDVERVQKSGASGGRRLEGDQAPSTEANPDDQAAGGDPPASTNDQGAAPPGGETPKAED